jgi:hypothetical protein
MLARQEELLKEAKRKAREMNLESMRLRDQIARSETGSRASSIIDLEDASTAVASRETSIKREEPAAIHGFGPPKIKEEGCRLPPVPLFGELGSRKRGLDELEDGEIFDERLSKHTAPTHEQDGSGNAQKRKRNDLDDDDDDLAVVAPPPKKRIEVIDLTDD